MSMNIDQVYIANPTTVAPNTALIYLGLSPFGIGDDSGILVSDFLAQIGVSPWTAGTGTNSAIGGDGTAVASGNYALAYGDSTATASGLNSFAMGSGSSAQGDHSFAMGRIGHASGDYSLAFGSNAQVGADYSLAFGINTVANGTSSISFGNNNHATSNYSVCLGVANQTNADYSYSLGNTCLTANTNSLALGNACQTNGGSYGVAIGNTAITTNSGSVVWGDSNASPNSDTLQDQFNLTFANGYRFFGGSLSVSTIGAGLRVAEGSNAKQGIATLVGGTIVVSNTSVTANSRIFLTIQVPGGTLGSVYISALSAGVSFAISSTSAIDTSTVAYQIFEPA